MLGFVNITLPKDHQIKRLVPPTSGSPHGKQVCRLHVTEFGERNRPFEGKMLQRGRQQRPIQASLSMYKKREYLSSGPSFSLITSNNILKYPLPQPPQSFSSRSTSSAITMKFTPSFAAIAALVLSASAAPVVVNGVEYPEGTQVEVYPNGLPKELIPRALAHEESTQGGLQKRANAGVYLCNDRNFSGYCVHIVAPLYQCGKQMLDA